ncbi:hypothetical protein Tco_0394127 [Tanacetum coccineum]
MDVVGSRCNRTPVDFFETCAHHLLWRVELNQKHLNSVFYLFEGLTCSTVNTASIEDNVVDENIVYGCIDDPNMPNLEEIVYSDDDEEVGAEADMNNLATTVPVSPILTTRVHKDHPLEQIIGDIHSAPQTRRMTKSVTEHGVEVKQKDDGIFISQDKYVADILKKFDFATVKTASTPMDTNKALLKDEEAIDVDVHLFQVTPKTSHLHDVKRIFRYLKEVGEGSGQPTDPQHTSTSAQLSNEEPITVLSSSQLKKTHKPRKAKRTTKISQSSGPIHLVADETVYKEWEDRMERAATTASSLEAEQDSEAQTRFEAASKQSNDPPLSRVNTLRSGEDSMKLKELMELCTKLSDIKGQDYLQSSLKKERSYKDTRWNTSSYGKEGTKRAGLNLQEESLKRQKTGEGSEPIKEPKANELS